MDFHADRRDEVAAKIAFEISEALSFEGVKHFLYEPNEVNDGVALISDSQQPFSHAKFELLLPRKWDLAISHLDEDGSKPFAMLRIFNGDFCSVLRLGVSDPMATAKKILESVR